MNKEFLTQTVRDNTSIIESDDNWKLLLYKEAYHIKRSTPFLNTGLKASSKEDLRSGGRGPKSLSDHLTGVVLSRP